MAKRRLQFRNERLHDAISVDEKAEMLLKSSDELSQASSDQESMLSLIDNSLDLHGSFSLCSPVSTTPSNQTFSQLSHSSIIHNSTAHTTIDQSNLNLFALEASSASSSSFVNLTLKNFGRNSSPKSTSVGLNSESLNRAEFSSLDPTPINPPRSISESADNFSLSLCDSLQNLPNESETTVFENHTILRSTSLPIPIENSSDSSANPTSSLSDLMLNPSFVLNCPLPVESNFGSTPPLTQSSRDFVSECEAATDHSMPVRHSPENRSLNSPEVSPLKLSKAKLKKKRALGLAYFNKFKSKLVSPRKVTWWTCNCKCSFKFSTPTKKKILENFNQLEDHVLQNQYLRGCISVKKVKRRRKDQIMLSSPKRKVSFTYSVTVNNTKLAVCKKAFHLLHGIRRGRIERKVKLIKQSIFDRRGRHSPINKKSTEIFKKVEDHILSFPARESHYCREKSRKIHFLDSTLTVSLMHRLFNESHPESSVSYAFYRKVFAGKKYIKIGYPRSDICDTCESLKADIARAKTDENKAEVKRTKELHIRKAGAFYDQLKNEAKSAKKSPNDSVAICFDYQKHLPLPLTNIGKEYYLRQLWTHNFGVHNLTTNEGTMFLYSEHFAAKGPNEVISCLKWYFDNKINRSVKTVHVFMDNCFAQCKNKYIFAFWHWLSLSRFQQIYLHFPIPGHSYHMPIDRDFDMIEKCRRRHTKAILPSTWVAMIKGAQPNRPFDVVYVKHPLTDDMQPDGTPIAPVFNFKQELDSIVQVSSIQKIRGMLFESGQLPKSRTIMSDVSHCRHVTVLKKNKCLLDLNLAFKNALVCVDFFPISKPKYDNIFTLLQAVSLPEDATFYKLITFKSAEEIDERDQTNMTFEI